MITDVQSAHFYFLEGRVIVVGESSSSAYAYNVALTVYIVEEGSSVMRGIRVRHASPLVPLVHLKNRGREHIHISQSECFAP